MAILALLDAETERPDRKVVGAKMDSTRCEIPALAEGLSPCHTIVTSGLPYLGALIRIDMTAGEDLTDPTY